MPQRAYAHADIPLIIGYGNGCGTIVGILIFFLYDNVIEPENLTSLVKGNHNVIYFLFGKVNLCALFAVDLDKRFSCFGIALDSESLPYICGKLSE